MIETRCRRRGGEKQASCHRRRRLSPLLIRFTNFDFCLEILFRIGYTLYWLCYRFVRIPMLLSRGRLSSLSPSSQDFPRPFSPRSTFSGFSVLSSWFSVLVCLPSLSVLKTGAYMGGVAWALASRVAHEAVRFGANFHFPIWLGQRRLISFWDVFRFCIFSRSLRSISARRTAMQMWSE
ncbi:uncharacterized protein J3D65DRAFT_227492 [Phyllosticta citribraziliensis]|uniref:Transmembrane protein n=1 Tax=Phyllosticta citribraziliensis TaxID=989973 RepID=A0ABR1M896_9PEZI